MKKVLLFADFGIDDTIALIYMLFNPGIEILGIVADYGNVSREKVLRNVNYIKYLSGHGDIPVFEGATSPLTGIPLVYYPEVHGKEGLGPITTPIIDYPVHPLNDVKKIIREHIDDLTVVNIGRLSSLATAFIFEVELMKQIKEYVIMGGTFFFPGNVTSVAEANFYGDPYAANLVMLNAKNMTIFPLNVTTYAILPPAQVNQINTFHASTKDPLGLVIKPLLDFYYQFYLGKNPGITGSPLHDVLPIWYLLNKNKVKTVNLPVKIVVAPGEAFGQSIVDLRYETSPDFNKHQIAVSFDYPSFLKDIPSTFMQKRVH
ncbi:nucleoside hydrolase [Pseudalkalibacillus sp. Hm43]|uniref:nucleoside hydrolase n=1 Tax=Pseudalkalibacillus sp. Hm43 TaxID=3450742 RepID=UPI003F41ECEF